jgi:hypothetical protein
MLLGMVRRWLAVRRDRNDLGNALKRRFMAASFFEIRPTEM